MSQSPITVTVSSTEILKELKEGIKEVNRKLDTLQKDVTDIKVDLTEVKTEVKRLKEDVSELKSVQTKTSTDMADLKGFKSLIIPIIVAFISAIVTVGLKTFFTGNNP